MDNTCTACGVVIPSPLYTYGDPNAPMCQSCHLGLLSDDHPFYHPLFSYDDLGDGWFLKRLTAAGAVYLGGAPGQALMRVHRGEGRIEILQESA